MTYRGQRWETRDPLEIQLHGFLHARAKTIPLATLWQQGELVITWGKDTMRAAFKGWAEETQRHR